jgi:hypothetical protein
MALPEGFSEFEHLQDQLRVVHNRTVRDWFLNVDDDDISTARTSIKHACVIKDGDTADMTIMRLWLFEVFVGHAQSFHPPLYAIPSMAFQDHAKFKPQITLFFAEDADDVEIGYSKVTGEISVRLTKESDSTITEADVKTYANKIKSLFSGKTPFIWKKGRNMYSYTDTEKGYRLQILSTTQAEAKRLIEQVLDIQSHTPDWANLSESESASAATKYPISPPRKLILGKTRRMPRRRPVASVKFLYALLHIYGLPNPIVLVDRSWKYRDPIALR